ncbi:hypothetical protein Pen02_48820 [Plantactinospora endophytica]|uniref:Uncharacterized protein n=1 Tax=Plantactinospora endophytica TaxID=673535 RepID=A0ABQ4E5G8_9ACTN|nr:hypothetical protein Pen02_48820 [Plantactinospora endophytica]
MCMQVVAAIGGFSGAALRDAKEMSSGQITPAEFGQRLRPLYTTAATKLRELAPQAADGTLRTAIEGWAKRMDDGAAAPDPAEYHTAHMRPINDEIEKTCKLG